ncbi:hypothetical protein RIF29_29161 [Crotalaria pallida]|uniref:Uncharacterized protein n=1 Tax=Crotalaria pallida TaxID=3830 RepID=A0AAN9HVN5_CROPI
MLILIPIPNSSLWFIDGLRFNKSASSCFLLHFVIAENLLGVPYWEQIVKELPLIGTTEWVEQNLINLGSKVEAYLKVDCTIQGHGLFVGSTPQLDSLVLEVVKKIQRLSRVYSDFAPFVEHAEVSFIASI